MPPAPHAEYFPRPWFQHSFTLDETTADLWGNLRATAALALDVLETPARVMGSTGHRHTQLVKHLSHLALYMQLERWQGRALALTLLEQSLELLC